MTTGAVLLPTAERRVFCNRTLNLRALKAVGFDMDYTLVHYQTERWEERAYKHVRAKLAQRGFPVDSLSFDPSLACLGLIIDTELGNLVKANRFGHVRRACHGTRVLESAERKSTYTDALVDLSERRYRFMNTLFSLSEACLFIQLVDLLDAGKLSGVLGYEELYRVVGECLDEAHLEGELKAEILADPSSFVVPDPDLLQTLTDLRRAGKTLLLITNSEWFYTSSMMEHALGRFLESGQSWEELFDLIIVRARKPSFFSDSSPAFELVDHTGLYRPVVGTLERGKIYAGGSARLVEQSLSIAADEVLYLGDHIFADVHVSKDLLRWRTALIVRELEAELRAIERFKPQQQKLDVMMQQKEELEHRFSRLRLQLQRQEHGDPSPTAPVPPKTLKESMQHLRSQLVELDAKIAPLAGEASRLVNERWGPIMRCGADKSHLARQIERYADIYMSRVSNLLVYTPFAYLRAPRGSLPHDHGAALGI